MIPTNIINRITNTTKRIVEQTTEDKKKQQESGNDTSQNEKQNNNSSPTLTGFAKLTPPKTMPASQIQRIKDLKCPPPIRPSKQSVKIKALNAEMQKQASEIEILEKQVEDLEKRYKIAFSSDGGAPKFDLQSGDVPRLEISGSVNNVLLDFHLWQARAGIKGIPGVQGNQGKQGDSPLQGTQGPPGYYGVRGDTK